MPCNLQFDDRVVLVQFHGHVTAAEFHDVITTVAAHPGFDEQRYHVVDCRQATLPPLDDEMLLATAPVIGATMTNPGITTIFIPDDDATRRLTEHCRPTFKRLRLRFARDLTSAMEWILAQTTTMTPVAETAP